MKNKLEYPITDEHRKHYVRHPIQKENGKWVAVDVLLPSGFIKPENNPALIELDTEKECQRGCDIHNNYHGWSKAEARQIIAQSMGVK